MKKIFLLIALSTIGATAFAQKIVKDEKDAFTGNHIVETSYVSISDGFPCSIRTVNGKCFFLVSFNCGDEVYSMEKGAEFMFKLQDDSIITLSNLEHSIADYWSATIGTLHLSHFVLKTEYLLSDEQIKQLQATPIAIVRFYTTDGYIERNVTTRDAKRIQKLFNLITKPQ